RDDGFFESCRTKPLVVVAEVKSSRCSLNQTWLKPESDALHRVLRGAGVFRSEEVTLVVKALQGHGQYHSEIYQVNFIALRSECDGNLADTFPGMPQILWSTILAFIHERFRTYPNQKCSHPQWDDIGKTLWNLWDHNRKKVDEFVNKVRVV